MKIKVLHSMRVAAKLLCLALLITACSSETDGPDVPYQTFVIGMAPQSYAETRSLPTGYTPMSGDPGVLRLFFVPNNSDGSYGNPVSALFSMQADHKNWKGNAQLEQKTHYVFGYLPQEVSTANLQPWNGDYRNGATLILNGQGNISAEDVCVIVGVYRPMFETDEAATTGFNITDSDVTLGSYLYDLRTPATGENNYMYILMNHIYAQVELNFIVAEAYDRLRTIVLKKVVMTTDQGTTTARVTTTRPYSSVSFEKDPAMAAINVDLLKDNEAKTLSTAPTVVPSFFTPVINNENRQVKLTCTYDVFDKKTNLIRENCTASNTLRFSTELLSGQKTKLNITVEPTYLYQLGEQDLDNPSMSIGE